MGGVVSSIFGGGPKAEAPDNSALLAQQAADRKKAQDDKAAEDQRMEEDRIKRMSGNFGRRSLFSNNEEGYTQPTKLGG
jgi:hypothetical protein